MAKCVSKTQFAGVGALVQLVGGVAVAAGAIYYGDTGLLVGGVIGVALLVIGSNLSKIFRCSDCGNRLDGRHVKLCPTCKAVVE